MKRLAAIAEASEIDRDECFAEISKWWNLERLVSDRSFRGLPQGLSNGEPLKPMTKGYVVE